MKLARWKLLVFGFRLDPVKGTDESSEAVLGASGQSNASAKAHPKSTVQLLVVRVSPMSLAVPVVVDVVVVAVVYWYW